jgi:D-serine deaminase-like pyridoxal phosphate-dependent protein
MVGEGDGMTSIEALDTPAALIDVSVMMHNIARMQRHLDTLKVKFRPHVKTSKCLQIVRAQLQAGGQGITVSTLKEAEQFFAAGVTDILYAVCIPGSKLPQALALRRRGCNLKITTDSVAAAAVIANFGIAQGECFEVWIEIDTDNHRAGVKPGDAALLAIAHALDNPGARLGGVLTHAGSSYELNTPEALQAIAEQERAGCVHAAQRLRAAGWRCEGVSVGSTPTALAARSLDGVTEVRAGVYVFFDLVMLNVGVCGPSELALSVLTTVIGHQAERGWAIVDAGWMAMSSDRGTGKQSHDFGLGQVCTSEGAWVPDYLLTSANQEHGIIARTGAAGHDIAKRFPMGTRLRILPNHACATAAQFPEYQALDERGHAIPWPRFYGW